MGIQAQGAGVIHAEIDGLAVGGAEEMRAGNRSGVAANVPRIKSRNTALVKSNLLIFILCLNVNDPG